MSDPIHIFYSYSHKDETLRDQLEKHLSILKRQNVIAGWHDRKIVAGQEWKNQIDENLRLAQVILLLVSPDFLNSDYCYDIETKRALERYDRGEAVVIPIILRPCDWHKAPFGKLQASPKDGKAVTSWSNRDQAWTDVAKGIRKAVGEVARNRSMSPNSSISGGPDLRGGPMADPNWGRKGVTGATTAPPSGEECGTRPSALTGGYGSVVMRNRGMTLHNTNLLIGTCIYYLYVY